MKRGLVAGVWVAACTSTPIDDGRRPPPPACLDLPTTSERAACLEPYFEELTELESPRFAVCRAATLQEDGTLDDCHAIAHEIGATAYRLAGDAGKAFAACGPGCIEGCLHGVMETFIAEQPDDAAALMEAVSTMCDDVPDDAWYACVHGVGHGLRFHGVLTFLEALAACHAAGDADWAEVCVGGVYMEQVDSWLAGGLSDAAVILPQICLDLQGDPDQEHCVEAIGEGLMFATGHDLEASVDLCLRLAANDPIAWCRHGAEVEAEVNTRIPPGEGCG